MSFIFGRCYFSRFPLYWWGWLAPELFSCCQSIDCLHGHPIHLGRLLHGIVERQTWSQSHSHSAPCWSFPGKHCLLSYGWDLNCTCIRDPMYPKRYNNFWYNTVRTNIFLTLHSVKYLPCSQCQSCSAQWKPDTSARNILELLGLIWFSAVNYEGRQSIEQVRTEATLGSFENCVWIWVQQNVVSWWHQVRGVWRPAKQPPWTTIRRRICSSQHSIRYLRLEWSVLLNLL